MIPRARVVHALPGRLRLKIGSRLGDASYFKALQDMLATVAGVQLLDVNPRTASVLLAYEQGALEAVSEAALEHQMFALDLAPGLESGSVSRGKSGLGAWGDEAVLDWRLPVAAVLIGLAIRQMAQGKVLAPALTLLWYAYELLDRVGRKDR